MNLDLEAMKAAALAATPGEWRYVKDHDDGVHVVHAHVFGPTVTIHSSNPSSHGADMQHIASASPAAVLALIERLEDEHAANAILIEENDRLQARVAVLEERLRTGVAP